jgi:hypothetical protein
MLGRYLQKTQLFKDTGVLFHETYNQLYPHSAAEVGGELKKGDFMHAKRQFSSEAKHVVQDTIGYTR